MKSKLILILHVFAILSGTTMAERLRIDFSSDAGTQAGWESLGGTTDEASKTGIFSGYTDLSAGNITVTVSGLEFNRGYDNGTGAGTDFPGTDLDALYSDLLLRNDNGATVDVNVSGLKAGTYQIKTHHLIASLTPGTFTLAVQDADSPSFGQSVGTFTQGTGVGGSSGSFNPNVITFNVVSNGTDPVILRMTQGTASAGGNTGGWFGYNGMEIIPEPTTFQMDFSTAAGTQAGWEALGETGSPSGSFPGYTGLADGNITVSLANIALDRLYKNGITGAAEDFPGTDLDAMYSDLLFRNDTGTPIDVTISGLRAGTYRITTHHLHDTGGTPSEFDLNVQDADSPAFGQFVGNFAMGLGSSTTFNPTVISFEVVSNGTDDILLQMDATFIGSGGNTGGWWGINGLEIILAPTGTFQLTITPATPPATGYDFQWASRSGKVYDLLTSTDLATPIAEWPVYNDGVTLHEAIPSAGETTTLSAVPSADPRRFFAVREYDAPPPSQ